jgi:benzil reductase ((S)-benzoin forming)
MMDYRYYSLVNSENHGINTKKEAEKTMFIVTGGGSGIGKALALALAERGKKVLIIGRRDELLYATAALCSTITYLTADVSTTVGRDKIYAFLQNETSITALINNAGILAPMLAIKDLSLVDWQHSMATNVEAPLFLTQGLLSKLKGGRVLNISSGLAHIPAVGLSAYCTSKAALNMLTRCWQLESNGVALTSVMPGIVDTSMQDLLRTSKEIDETSHQFYNDLQLKDKVVSPETVACFLCWLLLDVPLNQYVAKEWDLYEQDHHSAWLKPPHRVPAWSE